MSKGSNGRKYLYEFWFLCWAIRAQQKCGRQLCAPDTDIVNDLCNEMERSNYLFCLVHRPRSTVHAVFRSSLVLSSYLKRIYGPKTQFLCFLLCILRMAKRSHRQRQRREKKKASCFRWVHYPSAYIMYSYVYNSPLDIFIFFLFSSSPSSPFFVFFLVVFSLRCAFRSSSVLSLAIAHTHHFYLFLLCEKKAPKLLCAL